MATMTRRMPRALVVAALTAALAFAGLSAPAPIAGAATDNVVLRWNHAVLQGVRDSSIGPPMVARALAIVHTCIYDAWAAYDPLAVGTRYGAALRRPSWEQTDANKREAISFAAHRAAVDVFPGSEALFDDLMADLGYDPDYKPQDTTSPAGVGATACAGVLSFRHHDGSNQLGNLNPGAYSDYTGYEPVNHPTVYNDFDPATVVDPNRWQPLIHPTGKGGMKTQTYVGPHWGHVTPFALPRGDICRSVAPPAQFGTPLYKLQADDLIAISANLTDYQKVSAEYWADGPSSEQPPGHWNLFARFVSQRDQNTVDDDAKLFFALNNALLDAGIASWDNKRAFDYVRPITAIRYLYSGQQITAWGGPGQGTQTIAGDDWMPYQGATFPTPPFAEHVSGHSTYSAAAAEVLLLFTGSDEFGGTQLIRAGSSPVEPGVTPAQDVMLVWPTFSDAADEAGMSRRYGGIHFERADVEGRAIGREVGTMVFKEASLYWTGLHPPGV